MILLNNIHKAMCPISDHCSPAEKKGTNKLNSLQLPLEKTFFLLSSFVMIAQ